MPIVLILLATVCLTVRLDAQSSQIGRPPVVVVVPGAKAKPLSPIRLASTPTWIDTTNRAAVVNTYLSAFVPTTGVPPNWTGNIITGNAGSTSAAYQAAVLARINWFRQMAGVPTPITFSAAYSANDAQAALMMSLNQQVNHQPPTDWTFYSAAGAAAAANSNLCLDLPYLNDPGCIAQYMQDFGATNTEVGHRRWLLYPQTQNMGTGDVNPPYPNAFANALWVVDTHYQDARPATRNNFVAWPPPGFVPYEVIPGRWSFSYPGADFTNAVVTMRRAGGAVAVRLESPLSGYGENTVVWVPDNIDTDATTFWPVPAVDTPISVTVSHAFVAGVDTTFNYTVTVINPVSGVNISGHITSNGSPLPNVSLSLSGGPTATTDATGAYSFNPVPLGTYLLTPTLSGYAFTPSSRSASASTANADFTAASCDYSGLGASVTLPPHAATRMFTAPLAGGCPWTATSAAPWVTIASATSSGAGPVSFTYSFAANNGAARTSSIGIGGQTINLSQPSAGQSVAGPIEIGLFLQGLWVIDSNNNCGFDTGDRIFRIQIYGAGDTPVVGDWNGDGHTKAGVYHSGFWALDYNGNGRWDGIATDRFYAFGGNVGEMPIVGDWNGDGRSKIGVFFHGFWALDYNGDGRFDLADDRFYAFGGDPAAIPLIGDWNGDGRSKIGYFLNGVWVLDYNGDGKFTDVNVDRYYTYTAGDGQKPVVGDWTGSGTTKIGVWKAGFWALNTTGTGAYQSGVDAFYAFGSNTGETPVVGDWNGDGKSKIGYYLNGFWVLDYNGNGRFNGSAPGRFCAYGGQPGSVPILGKW